MKTWLTAGRVAAALAVMALTGGVVAAQEASPPAPAAPQVEAASPSPTPAPTPAPTPMPVLQGPGYQTMLALAAALQTEIQQHALAGAMGAPFTGRPTRMFAANVRMFARRTQMFHARMEKYPAEPFDVVTQVGQMKGRATMISQRLHAINVFESTWEDWDVALDVLDRMQKLLAGEKVTLPPPHTPRPLPSPPARGAAPHEPGIMPNLTQPVPGASPAASPSPAPSASPSAQAKPAATPSPGPG